MPPVPTGKLKKAADKLFSQIVRLDRGQCERCHRGPEVVQLQCAHIISRRYNGTRFDEDNALCLCAGCHFWAHQQPVEFGLWVVETLGTEKVTQLRDLAHGYPGRVSRIDYDYLLRSLKRRLKELEAV